MEAGPKALSKWCSTVPGNKLTALVAAVALSVGLAACGGGSSSTTMDGPTPAEMEQTSIASAVEAAKTAADALTAQSSTDDVEAARTLAMAARSSVTGAMHASPAATAASLAALDAIDATINTAGVAVASRIAMETATANRAAEQLTAIRMAAAAVDVSSLTTAEAIATAKGAIAALQAAIERSGRR